MRRTSFAVLVFLLSVVPAAQLAAQLQHPVISSSRQFSEQGNYDAAISILRNGLASRPADAALQQELLRVLTLKQDALRRQLADVGHEIRQLRGPMPARASIAGCSGAAPVRVGGSIKTPQKRHDVKPAYPPLAMEARVQGIVILEATIDCDGSVSDVRVLRGQPLLNDAAIGAVRQWRYTPTLLNGVPVPVIMTVTVTFTGQD